MLRKLALSLAIAGALGTSNANALGLGEIRITSALNEPLQAEIQLLQMRQVDPQQIQPRMANVDEFALAGIEKLRFLSDVKFDVKPGPSACPALPPVPVDGVGCVRIGCPKWPSAITDHHGP